MPVHLFVEEGPHRGLVLNLEEGKEWVIGRDPDEADFVIEDSTVSRKHARVFRTPEGVYLLNLSRVNPVLVNDEEHEERVLLKEGDRIQIGNHVLLFSEQAVPEMADVQKKPKKKKKKEPPAGYDDIFGDLEKPEETPVEQQESEPLPALPEEPAAIQEEKLDEEANAYDTIFEDTGAEEVPFNLITAETPLLLKVISGPNAGAEIGVEKGRAYVIGKDPNSCDIVFQDLSVSRNHARLSVSADGVIEIEDLGSKNSTVVNGAPIVEKTVVTPQDLIALGTTVFLIIDREAPQETIYSPMVPTYEAPKMAREEEAAPLPEVIEEVAKGDWKREPIPPKYLIAAGSFAAIFLIVFLTFFSLFKSKGVEIAQKEPVLEIKETLEKFKDVQFSYNPGSGKLFLVGHVQTGVDYQEMNYRVSQIPFILSVEDNVVIDELVAKTMNDVLGQNGGWAGGSIQVPEAGKFALVGYIQTNAERAALSDYLTVNFPYLDRLQNKVVVEENLNTQIQAALVAAGLGSVSFKLSNGMVVLSGYYSEKMEREYDKVLKEVNSLPGITAVKNFAIATTPNQAGIDISGNYRIGGASMFDGHGYSIVLNGRIFTLGDQVDGMKITHIERNTILLEKDGLKYKINYTQ